MFLVQNAKKFLRKLSQESKNSYTSNNADHLKNDNIFQLSEDMSNDPSLSFLTGNAWHSVLHDDGPVDNYDE
jgi:hypothetical protein